MNQKILIHSQIRLTNEGKNRGGTDVQTMQRESVQTYAKADW